MVHTIQVEALIENEQKKLRHGERADVLIRQKEESFLSLPREALLDAENGGARIFVVQEGRVSERIVEYGASQTADLPILKGLEEGERVLISGHTRLSDGEEVVVLEK